MKKIYLILIFFVIINSCSQKEELSNKTVNILQNNNVGTGIVKINNTLTGILISTGNIAKTGAISDLKPIISDTKEKDKNELNISQNNVTTKDDSITKFVNDKIHFSKLNYSPKDLISIKGEFLVDVKGNQTLRKEANLYLQELAKDFYLNFKVKLKVVSAYRSYSYQKGIKDRGCSNLFCAKPGYSEHQSGLAVDFFETTTKEEFLSKIDLKKYFEWLSQNAHKYGFHNSYKNGKEIDGYAIEPWHWRYLGVEFAKELQQKNMTYGEFYTIYGQK